MTQKSVTIGLSRLFEGTAKLSDLERYVAKAQTLAGSGNEIILTGAAPVWLYLKVAHALHGKAKKLVYRSPVTGDVVIFDHDLFNQSPATPVGGWQAKRSTTTSLP